ncbi:MAG: hypothetical protein U1E65_11940 [Myxococcota bacterium]
MRPLFLVGTIAAVLFAVDRVLLWLESRGLVYWRRRGAGRAAMGSALAELEAQLRPPAREVRAAQAAEPRKTEDAGE